MLLPANRNQLISGGLFNRLKQRFSYSEDDGNIIGEIPLLANNGICLLCNSNEANSEDHFPLKSMGNNGVWHYRNLHNVISEIPEIKIGLAQDGIAFKTLCSDCNSKLGYSYDPYLLNLWHQFKNKNGLVRIEYDFGKLVSCLAGHFVAASFCEDSNNPRINDFREIYSTENPNSYRIFVAPFKGVHSLVLNEMMHIDLISNSPIIMYAIKCNPLAIILTTGNISQPGYIELIKSRNKIRIDLDIHSDIFFPELYRGRDSSRYGSLMGDTAAKSIIGVKKLWTYQKERNKQNFKEKLITTNL